MTYEYITSTGKKLLRERINKLAKRENSLVEEVGKAAEWGDIGYENAEFDAAQEELGIIRTRLGELSQLLSRCQAVEPKPDPSSVCFGAKVTVLNYLSHQEEIYRIVGPGEASLMQEEHPTLEGTFISYQSPIGQALIGKSKYSIVKFDIPAGECEMFIKSIDNLLE